MNAPLAVQYTKSAAKYLEKLDHKLQDRIKQKVGEVAGDPENPRHSIPLTASTKRRARIGKYRIILAIMDDKVLLVVDIDSRGQVYRTL